MSCEKKDWKKKSLYYDTLRVGIGRILPVLNSSVVSAVCYWDMQKLILPCTFTKPLGSTIHDDTFSHTSLFCSKSDYSSFVWNRGWAPKMLPCSYINLISAWRVNASCSTHVNSFTDFSGVTHGREDSNTLPCKKTSGVSPMWSVLLKFHSLVFRLSHCHTFHISHLDSFTCFVLFLSKLRET